MRAPLLAVLALAAACTPIMEATTYDPARSVIEPAVAARVASPELARRIADCVILNATRPELVRIAADATKLDGPAPDIADLIADIMSRPETQGCVRG